MNQTYVEQGSKPARDIEVGDIIDPEGTPVDSITPCIDGCDAVTLHSGASITRISKPDTDVSLFAPVA